MAIPQDISPTVDWRSLSLATLSEADAASYATWFKALADPTRIRILNLLAQRADSVCFCDIADQFSLGQSTISHHLTVLRDSRLLNTTRQGTVGHYQMNRACGAELPEAVRRVLQGAPRVTRRAGRPVDIRPALPYSFVVDQVISFLPGMLIDSDPPHARLLPRERTHAPSQRPGQPLGRTVWTDPLQLLQRAVACLPVFPGWPGVLPATKHGPFLEGAAVSTRQWAGPRSEIVTISQPLTFRSSVSRPNQGSVAGAALRLLKASEPSGPTEGFSAQTYTRLLEGETVSWRQLLREHPLLGSITVARLVDAGVVRAWLDPACREDAVDFRLSMAPREYGSRHLTQ